MATILHLVSQRLVILPEQIETHFHPPGFPQTQIFRSQVMQSIPVDTLSIPVDTLSINLLATNSECSGQIISVAWFRGQIPSSSLGCATCLRPPVLYETYALASNREKAREKPRSILSFHHISHAPLSSREKERPESADERDSCTSIRYSYCIVDNGGVSLQPETRDVHDVAMTR